jgi:hypothetical protein
MMNALLGEPAMLPGSWPYCIPKQIRKCASKALSSLDLYLAWAAPQYLDEGFAPLSWVPDAPVHSGTNEHAAVHVAAIVDGHASSGLELSPCPSHPLQKLVDIRQKLAPLPEQQRRRHGEAIEIAVDRAMCDDCVAFCEQLARFEGVQIVVQDPQQQRVFGAKQHEVTAQQQLQQATL